MSVRVGKMSRLVRFGGSFGRVVFALFEDEGGATEAREGVEGADVVDGVIDELLVSESFKDLADCQLVGCLMKLDDVVVLDEVRSLLAQEAHFGEIVLVLKVLLEAALEPIGDVFAVE